STLNSRKKWCLFGRHYSCRPAATTIRPTSFSAPRSLQFARLKLGRCRAWETAFATLSDSPLYAAQPFYLRRRTRSAGTVSGRKDRFHAEDFANPRLDYVLHFPPHRQRTAK